MAVLPSYMSLRNFLLSGSASEIAQRVALVCIVPQATEDGLLAHRDGISFRKLGGTVWHPPLLHRLVPQLGYPGIAYRFNEIGGFTGHRSKRGLSPERRAREFSAGNYVEPSLGRPWASSRLILRLLTELYWSAPLMGRCGFLDLFRSLEPRCVILDQVQSPLARRPVIAARRLGIPVVGIIGSWDQPTTKGPVPAGLARYLVQNRYMKEALERHHGVRTDSIRVTGWPQMDCYAEPVTSEQLGRLRAAYGIASGANVVLFGLYSPRLGGHEPTVAEALAAWMASRTGKPMHLLLRPHPKTRDLGNALASLAQHSHVTVVADRLDDLRMLRDQIRLSSVVISSFGSIALDAVALACPAVYIGAGNALDWRSMEHLNSAIGTGAIPVASTVDELKQWIDRLTAEPAALAQQGSQLRSLQLEPLDGRAARRVAEAVLEGAVATRTGTRVQCASA